MFLIDNSNNLLIKKALHFLAETILMNSRGIVDVEIEVENVINNDNFDGKDEEVEEEQILNCIETVASTSSKYLIY